MRDQEQPRETPGSSTVAAEAQPKDVRGVKPGPWGVGFVLFFQLAAFIGAGILAWRRAGDGSSARIWVLVAQGILCAWLVRLTLSRDWYWRWGFSWPIRGRGMDATLASEAGGEGLLLASMWLAYVSVPLSDSVLRFARMREGTSELVFGQFMTLALFAFSAIMPMLGLTRQLPRTKGVIETFE